ncbi:M56 family metallopeptidase [Flavobacterium sp. AC]|uniref:M56 family metallopeptidase n=1 Tax=Flavobacterium azizsancarii TaxID=2961580 RepID=A0ABT4W9F6_9FLAO|nr:M56 family metallopeptidase [Flavobacterium azizsancarii]MDA6068882.1 M56 family metallopeptidase [Flavobacterium azizsancarii]
METLFIFIGKSSALLALFYCAYYFLLRKETFFNNNRWFLLSGLFTSIILPFIVYTKIVWVAPAPISNINFSEINEVQNIENSVLQINLNVVLLSLYSIGFLALLIKFAIDFYSLNTVLKGKKVKQQADFKFIDTNQNIAPFSYFDYIVYNSSLYTAIELESIIEHEKVHSEQNHTIDVLISRIFCVLFWFNPIVWLYKKAILQNLEFIADNEAAQKISDKKAYQYTLLKITTHENCVAITNHFYQSLIKKRIIMLNKNQSKKRNSWKFCVVIPALAAFVLLFQIEVIAKERQQIIKELSGKIKSVDVYKIKKNSTDAELKEIKEKLKTIHNVDFEASEIKRNSLSDLTSLKIDIKNGNQQTQSIQTGGNKTIQDFGIIVTTDNDGSKKVGIRTADETDKDQKIVARKNLKNVVNTSDNTNSTTTKTNSNSDNNVKANSNTNKNVSANTSTTNVNTDVSTNVDSSVTVNVNDDAKSGTTVKISSKKSGSQKNLDQLVIVDGVVINEKVTTDDLQELNIKSMEIYKGIDAIVKYGEQGKNGVIIIETRK